MRDDALPAEALRFAAQTLEEEEASRAAKVWDELVSLEGGQLRDAALVKRAREFKQDFLQRRQSDPDLAELRRTWEDLREGASARTLGVDGKATEERQR